MSMMLTENNTETTLTAAGTIPLGSAVHGYGKGIKLNGNYIEITGVGYYEFLATVNAAITGTAGATVTLYQDGLPLDAVEITPGAAGAYVEFVIPWVIRKTCGCTSTKLYLGIDSAATIANVTTVTEKE